METFGKLSTLLLFLVFFMPYAKAQSEFGQKLDFKQIKDSLRDAPNPSRKLAMAYYYWGHYGETNQNLPDSAFQYLVRSGTMFMQLKDTQNHYRLLMDQAIWLTDRGFDDEAKSHLEKALAFFKSKNVLFFEVSALAQLYRLELTKKNYNDGNDTKKPSDYLSEFEKRNEILNDTSLELIVLVKKADRLLKSRYVREAASAGYKALDLAQKKKLPVFEAHALYIIGLAALTEREYDKARIFLKRAESIPLPPLQLELRRNIYQSLAQLYTKTGELELGNHYAVQYGDFSDSLLSQRRAFAFQKVSTQFDTKDKEKTIESLKKEKEDAESAARMQRIKYFLFIVVLIGLFLFIAGNYRHRTRTARIIAEQKEALNQKQILELENSLRIETMQSMIAGQESERERVAKDMHDSVGGLLAAIKIGIQGLSAKYKTLDSSTQFANINRLLDETVAETRNIAHNLQPGALFQFGLVKAIQDLCGRFTSKGGTVISFQSIGDFSNLEDQKALNCYRIVQELLQNSVKHAEAKEILVQITRNDHEITLLVEDNGKGYDLQTFQKGMGTDNLSYRVKFLNGELSVHTAKGKGTSNMVSIPLG